MLWLPICPQFCETFRRHLLKFIHKQKPKWPEMLLWVVYLNKVRGARGEEKPRVRNHYAIGQFDLNKASVDGAAMSQPVDETPTQV